MGVLATLGPSEGRGEWALGRGEWALGRGWGTTRRSGPIRCRLPPHLTVSSPDPVYTVWPSALAATQNTSPVWPLSVMAASPESVSHTLRGVGGGEVQGCRVSGSLMGSSWPESVPHPVCGGGEVQCRLVMGF